MAGSSVLPAMSVLLGMNKDVPLFVYWCVYVGAQISTFS